MAFSQIMDVLYAIRSSVEILWWASVWLMAWYESRAYLCVLPLTIDVNYQ